VVAAEVVVDFGVAVAAEVAGAVGDRHSALGNDFGRASAALCGTIQSCADGIRYPQSFHPRLNFILCCSARCLECLGSDRNRTIVAQPVSSEYFSEMLRDGTSLRASRMVNPNGPTLR
jgi:hypothetical protein